MNCILCGKTAGATTRVYDEDDQQFFATKMNVMVSTFPIIIQIQFQFIWIYQQTGSYQNKSDSSCHWLLNSITNNRISFQLIVKHKQDFFLYISNYNFQIFKSQNYFYHILSFILYISGDTKWSEDLFEVRASHVKLHAVAINTTK